MAARIAWSSDDGHRYFEGHYRYSTQCCDLKPSKNVQSLEVGIGENFRFVIVFDSIAKT